MDIAKKLAQYAAEGDFEGVSAADHIIFKGAIYKMSVANYDNLPVQLEADEVRVLFEQVRELGDWAIQLS